MSSRHEYHDAIVVGAGPAGLAAAAALLEHGQSVRLIDEQPSAGGQIWRGAAIRSTAWRSLVGPREADRADAALATLGAARLAPASSATVIDARTDSDDDADEDACRVELDWLADAAEQPRGLRTTRARALVVATGALERLLLFPGAELPGVMGIGAVQSAMKQAGLVPDGPGIVLAGQGPLLLLTLTQLRRAGSRIDAVLDLSGDDDAPGSAARTVLAEPGLFARAALADPALMLHGARLLDATRGLTRFREVRKLCAHGRNRIERLTFSAAGKQYDLPCSLLAVHDGIVPNVQLSRLLGLAHVWHKAGQAFVPVVDDACSVEHRPIWIAGDARGVAGAGLAALRGRLAGLDVVRALGAGSVDAECTALRSHLARRQPARAFVDHLYPALPIERHATADTIVCRCEAVSLAQIAEAIAAGAVGANRVKTFTRCGMGACQGRTCSNALTRIIAGRLGVSPQDAGALRVRAPLKPVLIGDYLGWS